MATHASRKKTSTNCSAGSQDPAMSIGPPRYLWYILLICLVGMGQSVHADWSGGAWQRLGRWCGCGWSDGYHSTPPHAAAGAVGHHQAVWAPSAFTSWRATHQTAPAARQALVPSRSFGNATPDVDAPTVRSGPVGMHLSRFLGPGRTPPLDAADPVPFVLPGIDPDEAVQPSVHDWLRTRLTGH
jgi:hypothetical protein